MSTHPLLTRIVVRALAGNGARRPFAIVVTDLVTGHASWYEPGADLVCLPTPEALERAAACGVPRAKMIVTGPAPPPARRGRGRAARRAARALRMGLARSCS